MDSIDIVGRVGGERRPGHVDGEGALVNMGRRGTQVKREAMTTMDLIISSITREPGSITEQLIECHIYV